MKRQERTIFNNVLWFCELNTTPGVFLCQVISLIWGVAEYCSGNDGKNSLFPYLEF